MKSVALVLALAVITGCNARVLPQADVSVSRWEDTVDQFWQYISELNKQADGALQNVKSSQLSRELDTLITDTMAELKTYRDDIQTKLTPLTEISTGQVAWNLQHLANKLQKDMLDAKDRTTDYLGELKSMVELNSDDVRGRVGAYTSKLRKRLDKDTEEIRNTVATYMGELQSRTSQNLGTVRDHVEPYVQQTSDTASKKLSDLSTMLQSQAEVLSKQLETQAKGFKTRADDLKTQAESLKTQLEATAEELRASLEGKIGDLTDLLSPYATKIREQLDAVVEKVKETAA